MSERGGAGRGSRYESRAKRALNRVKRTAIISSLALLIGATALLAPRTASACGGCFNPPENPTVVTDHRMILSVSKEQSTLYDQIRYSGSPASFGWVLPISGEVTVGLSADVLFAGLDSMTQTQILQPPRNCPPQPSDCAQLNGGASFAPQASDDQGGVNVVKREVVGPYETVQLQATNPNALRDWLQTNGFSVPAEVAPVIDTYVGEHFNFLALKLVPGKDVQDMRPVRVTTKGANVALPLRMIAAGTGPQVGIALWVVGEGRYEPQNFGSFILKAEDISWDWTQNKSNYIDLRTQKNAAGGGRIWEIESSTALVRQQIESIVQQGNWNGQGPFPQTDDERAATVYLPVKDAQGSVTKTASQVRDEDVATLFSGITNSRVTRMRADLAHAALNADLLMTASADQTEVSNVRQVTKELNQPLCPVWSGCKSVGQAPRDEATARSTPNSVGGGTGETFACGASRRASPKTWPGVALAALAVVELARRARRRRS
jgi:hypothetical protein